MAFFSDFEKKEDAVKKFFEVHFGNDNNEYHGKMQICVKGPGAKNMKTVGFFETGDVYENIRKFHRYPKSQYYITANSFETYRRSIDELYQLKNIVIDIDMHTHDCRAVRGMRDKIFDYFISFVKEKGFDEYGVPCPNSIICTGRGLQLWFRIDDASGKLVKSYRKVSTFLKNAIEKAIDDQPWTMGLLHVDKGASGSPAGLYRFPGCWNENAGRYGKVYVLHDGTLNLFDFYKELYENAREDSEFRQELYMEAKAMNLKYARWSQDPDAIAEFRNRALTKLVNIRTAEGVDIGEELRDLFLLVLYCSYSGTNLPETEILNRVRILNNQFQQPMPETEWRRYLSTAARKKYRYSNSKIIDVLSITEEEQEQIGLKPTGSKAYDKEQLEKRKTQKKEKDEQIIRLCKDGKSKKEIASITELSEQTIGRKLKKWKMKTAEEQRSLNAMRSAGKSFSARIIMEKYGFSKSTAYEMVRKARIAVKAKADEFQRKLEKLKRIREEKRKKRELFFKRVEEYRKRRQENQETEEYEAYTHETWGDFEDPLFSDGFSPGNSILTI